MFILLLSVSSAAFSSDWVSPIDIKYKQRNEELFNKFDAARDIINSYRGRSEKLAEADKLLREILEEDIEYAPAYREYGRIYIMAGYVNNDNFKKGILGPSELSILKSIDIEPKYADSYVLLGHLYTKMKRYKEAQSALEKGESIGTKIPWLDLNWADLLNKQGKYSEALQRYKNVAESNTSNKKAYIRALEGITEYYAAVGDYEKVKSFYLKQIEHEPETAWIYGNYASFLLFKYGDVDGAIENSKKALKIMNYGMGEFILACALYTKWAKLQDMPSNKNRAEKYLEQAWMLYPYPQQVIKETQKYKYTSVTALKLRNFINEENGIRTKIELAKTLIFYALNEWEAALQKLKTYF